MSKLINSIVSKNFVEADSILSETVELIMARKLEEAKKMVAAKIEEQPHMMNRPAARLRLMDIAEEDVEEAVDPKEGSDVAEKGTPKPPKNTTVVPKNNMGGPGSNHYKNMKEEELDEVNTSSVNYQGSSGSSSVYTRSTKNPFNRGTEVLADKMKQNIGGATQSYKSKTTVKNLGNNTQSIKSSSSTSTMNEETEKQLDEARVKIVKARIRGGKIQRRKRVSNVPGYRVQGTKLQRMSPAERRRRKMGARKAKIKRKAKMSRTLMKRQRSIRRRKALGL